MPVPTSPVFKLVFGVLGNMIGVGVNLAPVGTFYNIYRMKSTQGFSGLPYVFALSAALLWLVYGNPEVTPASTLLLTINSASSFIQICYLTIFFIYGASNRRRHVLKVLTACLLALAIVAVATFALVARHKADMAREMVGILCVVIGIMSYASPLSVARIVIITRSVEFLPIVLCCFLFLNSVIWTLYGFFKNDIYVILPNGFGVVFGVAQLSLYVIFRNCEPVDPLDPKNWKLPKDEIEKSHRGRKKNQVNMNDEKSQRGTKDNRGKMNGNTANGDGKDVGNGAAANGDVKHAGNGHFANGNANGGHVVDVPAKEQTAARGDDRYKEDNSMSTLPGLNGTHRASPDSPNSPRFESPTGSPINSFSSPANGVPFSVNTMNPNYGKRP